MSKYKRENKITRFKDKKFKLDLNIGVIVFVLIFIYLIGICITYFGEHKISTYEVRYGSIIKDNQYRGIALRDETIYNATDSGYIQFYYNEGSRVGVNNSIYTISDNPQNVVLAESTNTEEIKELSNTNTQKILSEIQSFNNIYDKSMFYNTYKTKNNIDSIINNNENAEKITVLDNLDPENTEFQVCKSDQAGILMYTLDNYEGLTTENFEPTMLDKENYNPVQVSSGDKVTNNAPVYKIVTSEKWSIIFEINPVDLKAFEDRNSIYVRFQNDNQMVYGNFELIKQKDQNYGVISMNSDMIRYINQRFLDIELLIKDQEGYKIPVSSVVPKEFYKIPTKYIVKGGYYSSNGVLLLDDLNNKKFQAQKIYYQDEEYVYLSTETLKKGQQIIRESDSDIFVVSETTTLDGVYNINKGYAEYQCIDILYGNEEYYIIDDRSSNNIKNYDHIALYGDSVSENAILD